MPARVFVKHPTSGNPPGQAKILTIDVSNSFTKFAVSTIRGVGKIHRLPTAEITVGRFRDAVSGLKFDSAALASVVPSRSAMIRKALSVQIHELRGDCNPGIGIRYPHPESIGADRLANAIAAVARFPLPAVVVDFGTAVTFDVLSGDAHYLGGVIAPGLAALTDYLHHQTALLPAIDLRKPVGIVGKSTRQAMLSGAVFGYRGLVREILSEIAIEQFQGQSPHVVATGGDAKKIARLLPVFDSVVPELTLDGLRMFGLRRRAVREDALA